MKIYAFNADKHLDDFETNQDTIVWTFDNISNIDNMLSIYLNPDLYQVMLSAFDGNFVSGNDVSSIAEQLANVEDIETIYDKTAQNFVDFIEVCANKHLSLKIANEN